MIVRRLFHAEPPPPGGGSNKDRHHLVPASRARFRCHLDGICIPVCLAGQSLPAAVLTVGLEALSAIDGFYTGRLERNLGLRPAACTDRRIHLPRLAAAAAETSTVLPSG